MRRDTTRSWLDHVIRLRLVKRIIILSLSLSFSEFQIMKRTRSFEMLKQLRDVNIEVIDSGIFFVARQDLVIFIIVNKITYE